MSKSYPPGPVNEIHGERGLAGEIKDFEMRRLSWINLQ